jgi:serine/threonine-protein kinase
MDSARWQRIQDLFHEVADLPEAEQQSLLSRQCAEDPALLAEVMNLLREDAAGNSLLERDVAQVAEEVLGSCAAPAPPFERFGPYHILRTLGAGGMGIVYLVEREDLGSVVAIKILRDAWVSPARRERFSAEQRTLAQLNHPFIARLYDADTSSDGTPFFAMEYVEGVPLTAYCQEHRSTVKERIELFRKVLEAVVYAHQHAVIHRDLKPSNILVKDDGSVRLLDFGISKQLEALGESVEQTMTGLRLMTPAYASPEQIRGEHVGIQSDVYSLGVILYELLCGKLPFDLSSRTPAEVERVVTEEEPAKPSTVARRAARERDRTPSFSSASSSLWSDLDVLCLTAMHKDPRRRYPSAEALLRDVDHYLAGQPLEARPDSVRYRLRKFVLRNRSAVTAAAAAFLLVAGLITFFTVRLAIARNRALAEAARAERVQKFLFNLFEGGDEAAGPADDLRVVSLLDRGVREAQSLSSEPAVQAELYETLGSIYQKLGKLDQAESLLESSLTLRKRVFGEESAPVASSLVALAMLRASQARLPEAEHLARQGVETSRRTLGPESPVTSRATAALGEILEDEGSYQQAIPVLEEAVRLQSSPGGVAADLAESLTELANCHFYLGDYAQSDALNRRVLEMDRKLHGERHPHVADDLINLGANQYEWGHYAEAEAFYRQALDIIESWYGHSNPETASAMTMLGRALVAEEKFSEAGALSREALAIQEQVYGPVHPRVASALSEVGKVAIEEGKLDEAEASFRRMEEIYRSVYSGKHYLIGVAEANRASVYMEKKEYARAEALYRDALHIYADTLPPDHQNVGIGRAKLGRALLLEKRYADAEAETSAGYEILLKKADASNVWLKNAREDLVSEYTALDRPELAAKFRTELAKQ